MTVYLQWGRKISELEKQQFSDVDAIKRWTCNAEKISEGPYNQLWRIEIAEEEYYIKIYHRRGRYLRRYGARSRARGEWENAHYFEEQNILTPALLVYGESDRRAHYEGGFLVQRAVPQSLDLLQLAQQYSVWQEDKHWRRGLMFKVMDYIKGLHEMRFIHKDFKWRNILVQYSVPSHVYLIDSPLGQRRFGLMFGLGQWRDLRDFDKGASLYLSKTDRLRAYLHYCGESRLTVRYKKLLKKILRNEKK